MHRAWLIKTFSGVWACFFLQDIVPFGHKCFDRISYPLGTDESLGLTLLGMVRRPMVRSLNDFQWCVPAWEIGACACCVSTR